MTANNQNELFVTIIGAGFGGIVAGIHLKEKLGFHNFLIFEKGAEVGGTWRDNGYPGARCDVLSHFYSLSTDLNDWDDRCATQPDILLYMQDIVRKHDLRQHIRFNTEVISAEWREDGQPSYSMITRGRNGESHWKPNVIISALGMLHVPRMPSISGLDSFRGPLFHSAKWDDTVGLKGKRVAVIGNGCSAAQIMSEIPKVEGIEVVQFGRTPSWILPFDQGRLSKSSHWLLRHIPGAKRLYRWLLFWRSEIVFQFIFGPHAPRSRIRKRAIELIKRAAPKQYNDVLIPDSPVGSRRIIVLDTHLRALGLPNVQYVSDPIQDITPDGIRLVDRKEFNFDVIICATGFISDRYPVPIRGKNGISIQEYDDSTGGPNAYYGLAVPGFPNLAFLFGPNTSTGFTSVLFFEEAQMAYIDKLLRPILDGRAASFEVTKQANDEFNQELQERLERSVHSGRSWYRANGTGRNISIWPGSAFEFWRRLQIVKWRDFHVKNAAGKSVYLRADFGWIPTFICVGSASWLAMKLFT